ncbi:MAG: Crp/Fnr family transcriptional regulator [Lachnospiraceae bacterium]|nr:Crp/Fnr family transcriptional regulator [Lachnospiraceae bacterium]
MAYDIDVLRRSMLFCEMSDSEIKKAVLALSATEKTYDKNDMIMIAGNTADSLGLVIAGSVRIESNDMWGNRTILGSVGAGQLFAETYALIENEPLLVDVSANENCRILFFKVGSLKKLRSNTDSWCIKLISNLLMISAHKNLHLSGRSFHTSPKTIRGRVMAYLNSVSLRNGSKEFDIPFDRQQLADYLNLDRSALSKELGKMQKEGIICNHKNHFVIQG